MRLSNSMLLSLAGLTSLLTMFLLRGLDTSGAIVTLCLGYIGARAGLKGTGMIAASKDSAASTSEAIDKLKD